MKEKLRAYLKEIMAGLGFDIPLPNLDYPENLEHGDFSTNVALVNSNKVHTTAKDLAGKIVFEFKENLPEYLKEVTVAGPGFINFFVKDEIIAKEILDVVKRGQNFGKTNSESERKIMVEYTDPNPFKVIHIGHLMSNAIGESISRLIEWNGAEVKRANWQGDVGPHVAKALWGSTQIKIIETESPVAYWGRAYVLGSEAYEKDPENKKEIGELNKKIYDRSDEKVNTLYDRGRKECLEAFELVYKRLGTKFDNYFFESLEGRRGESIAKDLLAKGIFENSEGAVVFKGEKYGLHTRVFITSQGLPTYETKELGLNKEKFAIYPDLSESIIITANEQSDYFKVVLAVMKLVYPNIAERTRHIPHGMLRFASGKMSSRKGNVVGAESLIDEIKTLVKNKLVTRGFTPEETEEISDEIAIGAVKYTILRQSIGSDVIFDSSASVSFEGDSGPYLQYSTVRANSILEKAEKEGLLADLGSVSKSGQHSNVTLPEKVTILEKLITRFPDIVIRARNEYAPQIVTNYLINLAGAFNSFYASQVILDKNNKLSPYYLALTKAFYTTMTNGLWILGIKVPKKM